MDTILVLGGYGMAGTAVADLLLRQTQVRLVLAGRNLERARAAAASLNNRHGCERVAATAADAGDGAALRGAMQGVRMVVVASSTLEHTREVAEAALAARVDYFDLQLSSRRKLDVLKPLAAAIEKSGRCFITDGGFHPGLPAALVRYADRSFEELRYAVAASLMRLPWPQYRFSESSIQEFTEEMYEYHPAVFKDGAWTERWTGSRVFDFGEPFGPVKCMPMKLEEMAALPGTIPSLRDTAFFVNGFDGFTSNVVIPAGLLLRKFSPRTAPLFGSLLLFSARTFSQPPYGVWMLLEASGKSEGRERRLRLLLFHEDAYVFTAAPVVACLKQYLEGGIREPGLHWQAHIVDPGQFVVDLMAMGLELVVS